MNDPAAARKVLAGLIGSGIEASLSPAMHEREARHHGVRLHYQLIDLDRPATSQEGLPKLIRAARAMGFAGLNITYPCKQAVLPLLDDLSAQARAIGAVNTVVFQNDHAIGHNTDGAGWAWAMQRAMPGADLSCVVVLGAGGAGSAVADALLRLGAQRLLIADRDAARAHALAGNLNAHHGGVRAAAAIELAAAMRNASGLVHATPTGLAQHPGCAVPVALLRPPLWVAELVYFPIETHLLRAARERGCATLDGGGMAAGQAARAFELFTGLTADAERMHAHLRELLQAKR
jgi:shikimate dehydrogenase